MSVSTNSFARARREAIRPPVGAPFVDGTMGRAGGIEIAAARDARRASALPAERADVQA
jgi:hypothetical protein